MVNVSFLRCLLRDSSFRESEKAAPSSLADPVSTKFGHRRSRHSVVLHVFWDCLPLGDHRKQHTDHLQRDFCFSWAQRQIQEI